MEQSYGFCIDKLLQGWKNSLDNSMFLLYRNFIKLYFQFLS